ncbi:tetratricopeptide repeat protein [Novispirillum sp. DQ9]|uniref:tetratricopeptide repeat protein n=1 Tax=Novispirillum sp. DQ9 TaxID=3398612 RepID=UPI003C7E1516
MGASITTAARSRARAVVALASGAVALGLVIVLAAPPAEAAKVRAAPHDGYGRIVFDWPGAVRYSAEVVAGQLIVQFSEPVRDNPTKVLGPLAGYVAAAQLSDDRKVVTFPLKGPYAVNTFTLGSSVVVDLMGPAAQKAAKEQAEPSAAPAPRTAPPPAAVDAPLVPVRTGEHPGYHRMVFDFPKSVGYRVDRKGGDAVVTFQAPARIDTPQLNADLPPALRGVTAQPTSRTLGVTVPVPQGGRVRHFTIGPKVVVDILLPEGIALAKDDDKAKGRAKPDAKPAAAAPAKAEDPMLVPPRPPQRPDAVQAGQTEAPGAAPPAAPNPASTPAQPPATPSASAQLLEDAIRAGRGETPPAAPPAASAATTPVVDAAATPAADPATAGQRSRVASLSFSWDQSTAAAVFERGGYLWVVFDRYQEIDLKLLRRLGAGVVHHIEQRESRTNTVVRMIVEDGYHPSLRREGLLWIVDLMRQPYRPRTPVAVTPQASSPVGPRLYLPVTEGGKAMVLLDPEVGDRFIVVPVIPMGHGVYPGHSYPDAVLPVTAQGVVVEPRTDRVAVNASRNGVEVTSQGGMVFSPDTAQMQAMATIGRDVELEKVLDIATWMRGSEDEFLTNRQMLQLAVANAPPSRRNPARLELARFYFAHGYAAEALGVLRSIEADAPDMANSSAFHALRGAASYLMGRYGEAVEDMSHPSLANIPEAAFWRAAAQAQLGDPALQALTLRDNGGVISSYPRRVKIPLAIVAARAAVEAADDLSASNFLTSARIDENTPHEQAALAYIEGRQAVGVGNYSQALELWGDVADSDDRYYRALASRDRLELLHKLEELSREDLIKGLERLRFAWRGGDFEFDLLMRLGDLYTQTGDHGEALRVWQQASTYFSDEVRMAEAGQRMRDAFRSLYYDGVADSMPPVKAVALFDEFRHLTPEGRDGDEMIRRLADRLVSMDLLPQAAVLLERQVRHRLAGVERARVGARLGLVYLFDRQPQKAVEALLSSKDAEMPEGLDRQRRHLMARALSDMDLADDGLALLADDTTRDASLLRAEINWNQQDWAAAASALEAVIPEASRTLVLAGAEARLVLDWATALTLARDEAGVRTLRRRYGDAMSRTPLARAFELITTPPEQGLIDYRTVADRIKQAEDFRAFLTAYRDRLRTDGLSAIN